MARLTLCIFLFVTLTSYVLADIYLHNPRGSNNRLAESTRPRANEKRLFDSQNNQRGGYNVGNMYYYADSKLQVEWTNQHSCGGANSHCELVLQYMCGSNVRDGTTKQKIGRRTIPLSRRQCKSKNCDTDRRYGMHESSRYYTECRLRSRNSGLFAADQKVGGPGKDRAIHTRQDAKGTRYGYECPEERDYYPYWHPSPWKDIAIMTNDVQRCAYYMQESQNVKSRWACYLPDNVLTAMATRNKELPNNKQDCEAFVWPNARAADAVRGEWRQFPAHGIPAPECRETEFSRDNHLGNGPSGHPNVYNWTLPDLQEDNCALRIRYNVSTADYDGWGTFSANGTQINMGAKLGFSSAEDAQQRGYVLKQRPQVEVFGGLGVKLELNINTDQYGRTFQDRSHRFSIRRRPESLKDVTIHNVNVRGRRGNIVQVYPAVEYDYVPNTLALGVEDHVHFQWTGSNTNPRNDDGEGLAGTDRSNVLLQDVSPYDVESPEGLKWGHWGRSYPAHLANASFLGLSVGDGDSLASLSPGHAGGSMYLLDDAGTYFDLGPRRVTSHGTWHYMCSRNNNFSNRSQKGRIVVLTYGVAGGALGWSGGNFTFPRRAGWVSVAPGALTSLQKVWVEVWDEGEGESRITRATGDAKLPGGEYASSFVALHPEGAIVAEGHSVTVSLRLDKEDDDIEVYRANSNSLATWTKLDASVSGGLATFKTDGGGVFVARTRAAGVGAIVGGVVAAILVLVVVIATVVYLRRHPERMAACSAKYRGFTRSCQKDV